MRQISKSRYKRTTLLTASVLNCSYCIILAAAEPQTNVETEQTIERIDVSISKRMMHVDEIHASISVISEQEILALGADNLHDVLGSMPGVSLSQPLKNRSTINIRGINTDIGETQLTQDPVGLYVDDMPITGTYAEILQPDISLYDMQRVEVARGPQGTMYGSGNIAGAVRLITNAPQLSALEASARIDLGHTQGAGVRERYDSMLNLPLIKNKFALRIVTSIRDETGWVENIRLGLRNDYYESQWRAALLWSASENLTIKLSTININSKPKDGDSYDISLGQYLRSTAVSDARAYEMQLYSANIEYDIANFATFISSTNVKSNQADWVADLGSVPGVGDFVNQSKIDSDAFIQEFRVVSNQDSEWQWIAGLYFFKNELNGPFALNILGLQTFVNSIVPGSVNSDLLLAADVKYSMREQAAFADVSYAINANWEASLGLRYFTTKAKYAQFDRKGFDFDLLSVLPLTGANNANEDNGLMFRASVAYRHSDEVYYYFNLSKGIRAGQTNPNYGANFANPEDVFIPRDYQSDTLYNAELGATVELDGNLRVRIALFTMQWQDIQVDAIRLSDNSNYIANAGNAVSNGVEVALNALLNKQTKLYIALSWLQADIQGISSQQSFLSGALTSDELPGAPKVMANAGLVSSWQSFNNNTVTARVDARFVGSSLNRFSNLNGSTMPNPDLATNQAYFYMQGSINLQMKHFSVTAYVENVSNNDHIILNVGATQSNSAISLRPRTWGVRVNYVF